MGRRRKGEAVSGWICLDKPYDITSTHAVSRVRRIFNAQKAGHAGTLDPLATGILPIALGEATKTVPFLMDADKAYRFTIAWGRTTTTLDREGETGLVFVGGEFSHAIHKAPMIRRGVGPQDSLIENQVVVAATATTTQRALGEQAVAAAEDVFGPTAYARVDMVDLEDGTPALLELELLDPVLFLTTDPGAPRRFAQVLAARVRAGHA